MTVREPAAAGRTPAAGPRGPRELLRGRGFRELYAARLTSQCADGVFQAALVSFVLFSPDRATSPGRIAASLAIVLLPFSVIGPFAGIVIDRVSRRQVLVVSSVARAGLVTVVVVLIAAGRAGVDFYAVALAVFSVNRFVLSALSAAQPAVVEQGDLVTANALSTTSGTLITLVGAGIGSGIRGLVGGGDGGVALVAAVAAAAYLLAAVTAGRAAVDAYGPATPAPWTGIGREVGRVVREMAAGGAHLWSRRPARAALATLTFSRAGYGLVSVAAILLYRNYFTGSNSGLAGLAAVVFGTGVGTVAAAVVTPRVTPRIGTSAWISLVLVVAGVVQVAGGLPFDPWWFLATAPFLGFAMQAAKICTDTIVQEQVADGFRGRAFSIYDLLFNVAYVAAAVVGALTLPLNGRSAVVVVASSVVYAVAGLAYALSPGVRNAARVH